MFENFLPVSKKYQLLFKLFLLGERGQTFWSRGAWSTLQQAWLCHKTGLERRWNKEANGKSRGAEHLKMDSPLHICWGRIFPKYIYMYLRPLSWNFIIYDSEAAKILSWKSFWNINIEFTFLLIIVYFKTKYSSKYCQRMRSTSIIPNSLKISSQVLGALMTVVISSLLLRFSPNFYRPLISYIKASIIIIASFLF